MSNRWSYLFEALWRIALLGVVLFGVLVAASALPHLGPAYEEPADITAGYVALRTSHVPEGMRRPLLGPAVESLGLWLTALDPVMEWPGAQDHDRDRMTAHVLHSEVPVMQMLFWSRLPSVLATALTALVVFRLAMLLWRSPAAAMLASTIFTLLPSTLAHATRADGMALSALFATLSALAGWRWLRREGGILPVLGYSLAAMLTDFAVWLLIPWWIILALLRGVGLPPALPRLERPGLPEETALDTPSARSSSRILQQMVRGAWMPAGRWLLYLLVFLILLFTLWSRGRVFGATWVSFHHHWTDWRGSSLPFMFMGQLVTERPPLYHPVLLLTKTPLWLMALTVLGVLGSFHARHAYPHHRPMMIAIGGGLLLYGLLGCLLFPVRGYAPWVIAMPVISALAGGAVVWARRAATRRGQLIRRSLISALVLYALWRVVAVAPHWHAEWNFPVRLAHAQHRIALWPENDSGPALPTGWELAQEQGEELLFVAHHGRWSPRQLGVQVLILPSHGLVYDRINRIDIRNPPPGVYAISATLLHGQDLLNANTYQYFREHEPVRWIGGTVGIWHVEAGAGPISH